MLSRKGASRPGRLRHRVVLEKPALSPDGGGGAALAFEAAGALWAEIRPVAAEELEAGDGLSARVTHRVVVRFSPAIAGGDRFRLGERLFAIRAAYDPEEDGRYLVCLSEEEGR